eukprot:symbB.v1.2.038773.t2/scaffold6156.1/size20464/1
MAAAPKPVVEVSPEADLADAAAEEIAELPMEIKVNDPLWGATIAKAIDGKVYDGVVEDIEVGQTSGDRLYRVKYTDGDLEHMTEGEIRSCLVAEKSKHCMKGEHKPPKEMMPDVVLKKPAAK